ncbi:hypothetical protein KIL84_006551, partial [Mauremys mutica]
LLNIETTVIQEKSHKLFEILNFTTLARIALHINEDILELVEGLWQTQATLPSTSK